MSGQPRIRRDQLDDASLKLLKKTVISTAFDPEQYAYLAHQIMALVASDTGCIIDLYDILSIVVSKMTKLKVVVELGDNFISALISHLDDNNANFRAPQNSVLINCLNKAIQNLALNPYQHDILEAWSAFLVDSFNNSKVMMSVTEICLRALAKERVLRLYKDKPDFIHQLFDNFKVRPLANASSKCLQVIYVGLLNGLHDDVPKWFELWDDIFFETLMNKETSSNLQTYLLPSIIRLKPETLRLFVDKHSKQLLDNDDHIQVLIGLLTIGEQYSIRFSDIISFQFLADMLSVKNRSVLCGCLELLVLSTKATALSDEMIGAVKQGVVNFTSDCNSVDVRNRFINALNIFVSKVKDASYRLFKLNKVEETKAHKQFLTWLLNYAKDLLSPLASYSQTIIGFSILNKLIDLDLDHLHPIDDKDNLAVFPYSEPIFDERLIVLLFDQLNNNYDDVRQVAFMTLSKCPSDIMLPVLDYNDNVLSNELANNSFKLCLSLKSRESEGGAKFFQFYTRFFSKIDQPHRIIDMFDFLLNYSKKLDIEAPFEVEVPVEERIHGLLTSLNLMLSELPTSFFVDETYWSSYFTNLMAINRKVWNKVEPVLTGLLDSDTENEFTDDKLVINFSWKTIKESNNLLNVIFRINSECKFRFIGCAQLIQFVDLLVDQLSTIQHRGTVASIYPIFVATIQICFESEQTKYLPYELLNKNLKLIENTNQVISRRSGGLPNLVIGILTGEKGVLGSCEKSIDKTFEKLLDITKRELNPNYIHDLPQVNALNCIKTIFNDSYLANDSAPYLIDALTICLDNFNSTNWSVKNCSLMLFSTLKNKLFSSTLKLASLNFFKRYPNLKNKILQNLQNQHVEIVFSALELVSKLNFVNNKQDLQQFADVIIAQLDRESWLIREMMARTLGIIMAPDMVIDIFYLLAGQLGSNLNKNHGIMLSILELLKCHRDKISDVRPSIFDLETPYTNWSSLQVYVKILDLVPETPVKNINILANILLENLDTKHNGLKKLAVSEILHFLLKKYHQTRQFESLDYLIQITFDLNFEFSVVVMDFLRQHPESATNFDELWAIWGRDDYTHLKLLEVLCQLEPKRLTDEQAKLLSHKGDSEIRSKCLELLATFIGRGDFAHLKEYYLNSIIEFSSDSQTESIRLNCLRSVTNCIKSSKSDELSLKSFFTLVRLMNDDEDNVRQTAYDALSALLGLKAPRTLDVSLSLISDHIKNNYDQKLVERIVTENIMGYHPSVESKLNEYTAGQRQDTLFDVEVLNFYRQDVQMIEFFYGMLITLDTTNLRDLKQKCVHDYRLIVDFCNKSGTDGRLGYSRNYLVFGAIAQGIAELNSLRRLSDDTELLGLHQGLSKTLKAHRLHLELQKMAQAIISYS